MISIWEIKKPWQRWLLREKNGKPIDFKITSEFIQNKRSFIFYFLKRTSELVPTKYLVPTQPEVKRHHLQASIFLYRHSMTLADGHSLKTRLFYDHFDKILISRKTFLHKICPIP
jgi:hypothetical protein